MKKKHLRFAWVVLLGVILIRGLAGGGINLTSGLFISPVSQELGVGVGTLSLYLSIISVVVVLWLPTAGKLIQRYDIRLVAAAAAALQGLSFAAFGLMRHVAGWYLLAVPQAMGSAILTILLGPILINRWFQKNTGFIMGVQMAFVGLFGAGLQPVTSRVIAHQGWRMGYFFIGGVTFLIAAAASLLLLRSAPKADQSSSTERATSHKPSPQTPVQERGVNIPEKAAIHSASFVLLLIFMICMTGVGVFTQHLPTYGALIGYSLAQVGTALSLVAVGSAIGSIAIGLISDRIGGLKTSFGILALWMLTIGGFLLGKGSFPLFAVCAFTHGMVSASIMVLSPILTLDFYGKKDYEKIYAKVSMGAPLASILLIPAYGFIYDATNSYQAVLWTLMGLLAAAAVSIALGWNRRCTKAGCPKWGGKG